MVNTEWWMLNSRLIIKFDKWWMKKDEWNEVGWMMNCKWWIVNDEWWMMNDECECLLVNC